MKLIPLSKRGKNKGKYFAQVDDEDYDLLMQFNWYVQLNDNGLNYATSKFGGKIGNSMHRFLLDVTDRKIFVDHKDHNGLNNQRVNLRLSSNSQNQINSRVNYGSSKFRGVRNCVVKQKYIKKNGEEGLYINNYWRAKIVFMGKAIDIGCFKKEEDAVRAYDKKAKELFGEFAVIQI